MKLFKTRAFFLSLFAGSVLLTAGAAKAQNSFYAPGDLVLFFQQEGGDNTVYVNLGNAASYRDASSNLSNIVNINAALNSAFGATWTSMDNIYAGMAAVWGTSTTQSTLQNGDPNRTLYVSQSRSGAGQAGYANSSGYVVNTNTGMTSGADGITLMNNPYETGYNGAIAVVDAGDSNIDDQNPFLAPGIQGTAFGIFAGGVQQVSSTGVGDFGTIGSNTNVEFALDLYRILARTNIAGQTGGPIREGTFEGTFTIDSTGNVSYVAAVPEPSTWLLFGMGSAWVLYGMRRRRAVTEGVN